MRKLIEIVLWAAVIVPTMSYVLGIFVVEMNWWDAAFLFVGLPIMFEPLHLFAASALLVLCTVPPPLSNRRYLPRILGLPIVFAFDLALMFGVFLLLEQLNSDWHWLWSHHDTAGAAWAMAYALSAISLLICTGWSVTAACWWLCFQSSPPEKECFSAE